MNVELGNYFASTIVRLPVPQPTSKTVTPDSENDNVLNYSSSKS